MENRRCLGGLPLLLALCLAVRALAGPGEVPVPDRGHGTTAYTAYIIVHRESGIESLDDLRGKRFVFVDPGSASGYLFPYVFFLKNGIDPGTYFGEILFAGNHVEAVRLVAERKADAAAVSSNSLETARDAGIPTRSLKILEKTGRIPHDTVCARRGLDPETTRAVRRLLLDLDTRTEQGRRILRESSGVNGWMEVQGDPYAGVQEVLERMEKARGAQVSPSGE